MFTCIHTFAIFPCSCVTFCIMVGIFGLLLSIYIGIHDYISLLCYFVQVVLIFILAFGDLCTNSNDVHSDKLVSTKIGSVLLLQDGGEVEISGSPTEKAILSWAVKVLFPTALLFLSLC